MRVLWQVMVGALVAAGFTIILASSLHPGESGTFGLTTAGKVVGTAHLRVTNVAAESPASRAGIKAGDELFFAPSFASRIALTAPMPGDRVILRDGNRTIELVAVIDRTPQSAIITWIIMLARLAFLAMAALIAWRRPDDSAARGLSVFLACYGTVISYDTALFPAAWERLVSFVLQQTLFFVGLVAVFAFAVRFPALAQRGMRKILDRSVMPITVIAFVIGTAPTLLIYLLGIDIDYFLNVNLASTIFLAFLVIGSLLALIDSYRNASAEQRPRLRWVVGTFVLGFSGFLLFIIAPAFGVNTDTDWLQFTALTILAIPFGLAYVILRHRVLDVTFVINRAVVYTGVSVVVVGTFILFEWLLAHLVEQNSRASTTLQLGGALLLGLSVRFIHARVDRYVDDLFFRERHMAEEAIRRFAREAPLITDPDDLVEKTVEVAQRNARLSGVAFYAQRNGCYVPLHSTFADAPEIGENDYAILGMRTWHQHVDLTASNSTIPGELALPMMVRGRLAGFLACGSKTNHEALAPDESDALSVLARDAGIALDSLRIQLIERELAFLTHDGQLPPAVRTRLAELVAPG